MLLLDWLDPTADLYASIQTLYHGFITMFACYVAAQMTPSQLFGITS